MEILTYLILGHFIADYPLQPGWLVAYKKKSLIGLLIHTLIHLAVTVALIFPYWHLKGVWWAVIAIFLTHNVIDYTKVRLEKFYPKHAFLWYVLDQVAHLAVIALVYMVWLREAVPKISKSVALYYQDLSLANFVLVLVLATFVYDVTRWSYLSSRKKRPYVRDWGMMGRNALIVLIAFVVYWLFG